MTTSPVHFCRALAGAVVLTAAPAHADEPGRLSLSWTAPPDCPNGDAVRDRVDSLLGSPVESRLARPFDVRGTIASAEGRMELRLETNDNGLPGSRSITGASCDELASAGALVIALAIDPAAVVAHGGVPSAAFNPDAPSSGPRPATPPATPLPPPPAPAMPPPATSTPEASANAVRGIVGARMIVDWGSVSSSPSLGAELGAGFLMGTFLLRLDAKYFPPRFSEAGSAGKGADISLAAAGLSGCYVSRSGRIELTACGEVETGVFMAKGTGLRGSNNSSFNQWFAPGVAAGLAIDVAEPLCVLLDLGALVPVDPPPVQYICETCSSLNPKEIFTPGPVVGRAGIGLGVALE